MDILHDRLCIYKRKYLARFFSQWECCIQKLQRKSKHILRSMIFFFENPAVYEIMWKNMVQSYRPLMRIGCMRFLCWITKATDTHSVYVILLLFHGNNECTNAPQCYVCSYSTLPALSLLVWNYNFVTLVNTHIVRCVLYCPIFTDICLKIEQIKGAYKRRTQQSIINWIISWRSVKRRVS